MWMSSTPPRRSSSSGSDSNSSPGHSEAGGEGVENGSPDPLHYDALRALLPSTEAFKAQRHIPSGGMAGVIIHIGRT
jgi:hypothetical protein